MDKYSKSGNTRDAIEKFLVAHHFTTHIVSGGGRDFMRPVTEQLFARDTRAEG